MRRWVDAGLGIVNRGLALPQAGGSLKGSLGMALANYH